MALQRQPDLLLTVDNGISSVDGVAAAKAAGLKVLVTDHHLPGPELPAADAIVNPNQPGCDFPSKAMAGVGVMFYVLLALRARLREPVSYTHLDVYKRQADHPRLPLHRRGAHRCHGDLSLIHI